MTRRRRFKSLRNALRRRKRATVRDDVPRTRVSTAYFNRAHAVVSPERDMSEWVHNKMKSDWDDVVKGKNDG